MATSSNPGIPSTSERAGRSGAAVVALCWKAAGLVCLLTAAPEGATAQTAPSPLAERPRSAAPEGRRATDPDPPTVGDFRTRTFHVTPYLWASGLRGRVGVLDRTVDVDVGFVDIVENLDGAAMLAAGASRGSWGAGVELIYLKLSSQRATPGPLFSSAELEVKQLLLELTGRYVLSLEDVTVDLLAGGRYWRLDSSIDLTEGALPAQSASDTESWFDPIVGAAAVWNIGPLWMAQARGDVGGFDVGSELTWQLLGLAGYRLSDAWTVRAGYRYLDVDYAHDGFTYDVANSGFVIGATFSFE